MAIFGKCKIEGISMDLIRIS